MGSSSRNGLELKDTSRTNFGGLGLGLGLEDGNLEHIPEKQAVLWQLASTSGTSTSITDYKGGSLPYVYGRQQQR